MKICACCHIEKELDCFPNDKSRKDGKYKYCKECQNKKAKKYYSENGKFIVKQYHENHKQEIAEYNKQWREENKEELQIKAKLYIEEHKEESKEYRKKYKTNRKKTDSLFKLKLNINKLISLSIKRNGYKKNSKTVEILGCSIEEFKQHLESKFEPWMNWDNYGKYNGKYGYGWDIDHIIPLASATSEEEIKKLNHYTNLQPLDSYINRDIKKDKIDYKI